MQKQPPAVRTAALPFMHPVQSPFQEQQEEDIDDDDDALTICEEQMVVDDTASYALQQQMQQANMPHVVTAMLCKSSRQNHSPTWVRMLSVSLGLLALVALSTLTTPRSAVTFNLLIVAPSIEPCKPCGSCKHPGKVGATAPKSWVLSVAYTVVL